MKLAEKIIGEAKDKSADKISSKIAKMRADLLKADLSQVKGVDWTIGKKIQDKITKVVNMMDEIITSIDKEY